MARIASLADNPGIRPLRTIRIKLVLAVRLVIVLALAAVEARVRLRAHANPLADFDERNLWSNADGCADDFCFL